MAPLSGQAALHAAQNTGALQAEHQDPGDHSAHAGGDEEGHDVGVEGDVTGALAHQQEGDGIGAQTAEDGGAEHRAHEGGQQLLRLVEDEAAEQRTEHTARESHQAAQTQQVAQQGGHEGYAHAIVRPQQDGTEDVDHVLDGGAFAAEDGESDFTGSFVFALFRFTRTSAGRIGRTTPL